MLVKVVVRLRAAVLRPELLHRGDRCPHDFHGRQPGRRLRRDGRERRDAPGLGGLARHHHQRRAAVGNLRSVAGSHDTVVAEDRLQRCERCIRRVASKTFVACHVAVRGRDGGDFVVIPAGVGGVRGAAVRLEREAVAFGAADAARRGNMVAGAAHSDVVVRVAEPVVEQVVDRLAVGVGLPLLAPNQERRARHRLHSARNDDVVLAGADSVGRVHQRFHPRAAHLVDIVGWHCIGDSAGYRRLPRRVLPQPRREHDAHDHFADRFRRDTGAGDRSADDRAPKVGRADFGQRAAELALRRAGEADDNRIAGVGHWQGSVAGIIALGGSH